MTQKIKLWGAAGSPFTRSVQIALDEKGLSHELIELPLPDYKGPEYLSERHPFGRIPAIEIDGFRLYETQAIIRFLDELRPEPSLQPGTPFQRARMNQMLGILDCYGWPSIGAILLNRILRPMFLNEAPIEAEIEAALPQARTTVQAFADLMDEGGPFLCGERPGIADIMIYQIMAYFIQTAEGAPMIAEHPRFAAWIEQMAEREGARMPLAA
ncbi:MAG TPA: glutathione S-transferase family protein [Allosphingosinicella sp.]|uniref:glutathione S-transferase family protein n=1 Tax=Allosphingosinicella sp. TaxID=2823234 RepID=UPI002EDA39FD